MAAMPPSLLAHFQQLNGTKGKKGSITSAKPPAGTTKTAPGTKKPKKGKSKGSKGMMGVPLSAGQKRLPIGLQNAILRSRGFKV